MHSPCMWGLPRTSLGSHSTRKWRRHTVCVNIKKSQTEPASSELRRSLSAYLDTHIKLLSGKPRFALGILTPLSAPEPGGQGPGQAAHLLGGCWGGGPARMSSFHPLPSHLSATGAVEPSRRTDGSVLTVLGSELMTDSFLRLSHLLGLAKEAWLQGAKSPWP